jgi:hypothetical protein
VRTTALGCGHWLVRGDDEEILAAAVCAECGAAIRPLVTWQLDADGHRILFAPPALAQHRATP